jgi:hypothetical protein
MLWLWVVVVDVPAKSIATGDIFGGKSSYGHFPPNISYITNQSKPKQAGKRKSRYDIGRPPTKPAVGSNNSMVPTKVDVAIMPILSR